MNDESPEEFLINAEPSSLYDVCVARWPQVSAETKIRRVTTPSMVHAVPLAVVSDFYFEMLLDKVTPDLKPHMPDRDIVAFERIEWGAEGITHVAYLGYAPRIDMVLVKKPMN